MEKCPKNEEVRSAHGIGLIGGIGCRLEEVAVDREAVVGVALVVVAHVFPLGELSNDETLMVERLEGGDGAVARQQQPDERIACARRPGVTWDRRELGQPMDGAEREWEVPFGSHRSESPGERGVGLDRGSGFQCDLVSGQHDPGFDRCPLLLRRVEGGGGAGSPEPPSAPGLVADPSDRTSCLRHRAAERIGVVVAKCGGDCILLLEEHAIKCSPGDAVELDTDAE